MAKTRGWDSNFLRKQTQLLEAKLDECLEQQTRVRNYLANIEKDGLNDPADKANAVLSQELNLRQANCCAEWIFKVCHAIIAIKSNTYGTCENCGKPIPKIRLEAVPWATECTGCQQTKELRGN